MADDGPITRDEMVRWFGEPYPAEVIALLWGSLDDMTIGEVRAEVRRMARERGHDG